MSYFFCLLIQGIESRWRRCRRLSTKPSLNSRTPPESQRSRLAKEELEIVVPKPYSVILMSELWPFQVNSIEINSLFLMYSAFQLTNYYRDVVLLCGWSLHFLPFFPLLGPASDGVHSLVTGSAGECDSAGSQPVCQSQSAAEWGRYNISDIKPSFVICFFFQLEYIWSCAESSHEDILVLLVTRSWFVVLETS